MAALRSRCGHYIFALWFLLSSSSFYLFPRLISTVADWLSAILQHMVWPQCEFRMQVWNVLHAARWKIQDAKNCQNSPSAHYRTTLSGYIVATKARIDNRKKLVKQQCLPRCPHNIVNFGPLAAEIGPVVWGILANFNGFRVLVALLHGTVVVCVRQTLRRWTESATYIRQGGHHVGHRPTF